MWWLVSRDSPNVVNSSSESLGVIAWGSNVLSDFCSVLNISHGSIRLFGNGFLQ